MTLRTNERLQVSVLISGILNLDLVFPKNICKDPHGHPTYCYISLRSLMVTLHGATNL